MTEYGSSETAEPYKLCRTFDMATISVGNGLQDVPIKSFCHSPCGIVFKSALKKKLRIYHIDGIPGKKGL